MRVEELPAKEQELVTDEAEAIKGGFDPQPDPPAFGTSHLNPGIVKVAGGGVPGIR